VTAPRGSVVDFVKLSRDKARIRTAGIVRKIEVIIGGFALIQSNPANFHSHLKSMATPGPRQVVDDTVGGAYFVIGVDIVDGDPVVDVDGVVQWACLGIDEGSPVDKNFGIIHNSWRESLLQGQEVIRGMVDRLNEIIGNSTAAVSAAHQADVALCTPI